MVFPRRQAIDDNEMIFFWLELYLTLLDEIVNACLTNLLGARDYSNSGHVLECHGCDALLHGDGYHDPDRVIRGTGRVALVICSSNTQHIDNSKDKPVAEKPCWMQEDAIEPCKKRKHDSMD